VTVTGGCGTTGAVTVTVTVGAGSTAEPDDDTLTPDDVADSWRGDAGFGLSLADGADDAGSGVTPARGRSTFAGERCRLGSGEACGSLCTEPETVSACGMISTADACGSRAASRAEGEADPTPNSTIALYRTAEAAVAERPSLHWPPGLCFASPINPLSG
jgi:hypothetical protein